MHKDTYELLVDLMEQAPKRDPGLHGMYIYNDFFGYAMLELVDELLQSAHKHVTKKEWIKAWAVIDAITHFTEMIDFAWAHVDDVERVIITEKAYGALAVATVRALEAASLLNEETIPNLEWTLKHIAVCIEDESPACAQVLKGYGKKLFGSRTAEERKQLRLARNAAYDEFVRHLSHEERERRGDISEEGEDGEEGAEDEDDEDEDMEEDESADNDRPWFADARASDADLKDSSLRVPSIWKQYRRIWSESPHFPLRGPKKWDLTTWTAAEKRKFSFDTMNEDDDF